MLINLFRILFITVICTAQALFMYGQADEVLSLNKEGLNLFDKQNKHADALGKFKKSLSLQLSENQSDKEMLARTYRNIGMCQLELSLLYKAKENLSEAIGRYQKLPKQDSLSDAIRNRIGLCYRHRARTFRQKGEYKNATGDVNIAFDIFNKTGSRHSVTVLNLLANIQIDEDKYTLAEETCHAAIQKWEDTPTSPENALADIYHTLALANIEQAKYKQAIKYQKEALRFTDNAIDSTRTFTNIGSTYFEMGDLGKAKHYTKEALILKQKTYLTTYHHAYAPTLENFGLIKIAQKQWNNALDSFQLALINLTDNFRNQDINTNPAINANHYTYNKPDLLRVLDLKAQAALKAKKIDLAHDTYQTLDNWINEFYKDLSTNQSKLTWIARAHAMYSRAIEVALEKGDKEKAFEYAEKARAVLLWQSHSQQAALSLLDKDKREKYDNLLAQIRQADHEYRNAETHQEKSASKTKLDESKSEFDQFETSLGDDYFQRKYQPKTITAQEVQESILNDSTALVEYHWSADDMLYIFTLTKNNIYADSVRLDSSFHNQIQKYNTAMQGLEGLGESGYPIYQTAFEPIRKHLKNIKKIILLPDGQLNYIPFEALPTKNDAANMHYLLDDYMFNYRYSCENYSDNNLTDTIRTILYIAPQFDGTNNLAELKNPKISRHLNYGKLIKLTEKKPTQERVTQEISDADLVHFHTHAEQGGKGKGKIHLSNDDELTQDEIQGMELKPPRHVVLSACETGIGDFSKGEGVLSLGWSFVYRGVPSIVTSLWKVNEKSTGELMKNYYKLLKKYPTDEALQKAKMNLKKQGKHPYHWSAFIHTGNPLKIQFIQNPLKYLYLSGGFLIILFLLIYFIRRIINQ